MPTARTLNCPKMRALREILADGQEHTAWELTRALRIVDLTLVRELRQHGWDVPCTFDGAMSRYRYSTADLERHIAAERAHLAALNAKLDAIA
jgi:hypothetical protein